MSSKVNSFFYVFIFEIIFSILFFNVRLLDFELRDSFLLFFMLAYSRSQISQINLGRLTFFFNVFLLI
jgi:hypothetical protein